MSLMQHRSHCDATKSFQKRSCIHDSTCDLKGGNITTIHHHNWLMLGKDSGHNTSRFPTSSLGCRDHLHDEVAHSTASLTGNELGIHANGRRKEFKTMSSGEVAPPPTLCDRGMLQTLEGSTAPYFGKTLTHTMLQRTERVGIPSWFLHEHGDRLHAALSLTGPSGNSRPVMCVVRVTGTRPRVYLGQEWLPFAKENGFRMGDQVVFWLVARSSFHVRVKVHATTEGSGITTDGVKMLAAPEHGKEADFSPSQINCNPAESCVPACGVQFQKPFQRSTSHICKTEYVRHPGLSAAVSANSRFPQFVKKLGRNHVHGSYIRMELPWAFVKEHGGKFQAKVALLGASGHLRIVNLRIGSFSGVNRVHLGKGWREFTLENGMSEGDVLLFSLVGLSKFVVQMFPKAGK